MKQNTWQNRYLILDLRGGKGTSSILSTTSTNSDLYDLRRLVVYWYNDRRMAAPSRNCVQWWVGVRQSQMVYMPHTPHCTPFPITEHLQFSCSSDRHARLSSSFCWSTYMAGVPFFVPATDTSGLSIMFLLWPWKPNRLVMYYWTLHRIQWHSSRLQ